MMSQTSITIKSDETSTPQSQPSKNKDVVSKAFIFILLVMALVVAFPFIILYVIVCWLLHIRCSSPLSIYKKLFVEGQETAKSLVDKEGLRIVAIRRRFMILCLTWVVVNLSVRELRSKLVLGSELWKWSILVAQVTCGYHICSQGTKILVNHLLCKKIEFNRRKYAEFYAKGTRRSLSLVLYSGSLMLTWLLYFRRSWGIKRTPETKAMLHVGTWSIATLTAGSVLWLFKRMLVLLWEVNAVYTRFEKRILEATSIHFHDQIQRAKLVWEEPNAASLAKNPERKEETDKQNNKVMPCPESPDAVGHGSEAVQDTNRLKNKNEREEDKIELVIRPTMYDIKRLAKFFVELSRSSRKDDYSSDDILASLRGDGSTAEDNKKLKSGKYIQSGKDAAEKLFVTGDKFSEDQIRKNSKEIFEKSMETTTNKTCLDIGCTLYDAREVVKVLDRVWTCIVVLIGTIAWLLLTDIVSTKVLVLMVSPFLAATFVFGDTSKRIFEGIIFSFVDHPFDVGDRCTIEEKKLEVKRMSIFSTTFKVIETKEELLYPNSQLSSIPIIHLREQGHTPDEPENNGTMSSNDETGEHEPCSSVVVKETGDKGKQVTNEINSNKCARNPTF